MPPQRILIRGVNWLGDAVMTTPALLRLREAFPEAHVSILTPQKLGDLWRNHPAVDAALLFRPGEGVWRLARQLRREGFEVGLVFPNSTRAALELWLARVPRRVGYAAAWRRWLLTDPLPQRPGHVRMRKRSVREVRGLLTRPAAAPNAQVTPALPVSSAHQLHHYLHLAAALGARPDPLPPRLFVSEGEVEMAGRRFGFEPSPAGGPALIGLNAGAEYGPAKRWPRERFVAAAAEIQRRSRCRWLVLGGPGDEELAARVTAELAAVASESPVLNLAGRTSLRELCAVLKACRVLLTNDTGPMHVAAAVGTPVVVPFGSTSPELTGPGLPRQTWHRLLRSQAPCAPCYRRACPIDFRCMQQITVEQVVGAVLELLARARP